MGSEGHEPQQKESKKAFKDCSTIIAVTTAKNGGRPSSHHIWCSSNWNALQSLNLYGGAERKIESIFILTSTLNKFFLLEFLPQWTEQNRPYVSFHMVHPGYLSIFFNREKRVYVGTVLVHNGQFPQKINGKSVKLAVWAVSLKSISLCLW